MPGQPIHMLPLLSLLEATFHSFLFSVRPALRVLHAYNKRHILQDTKRPVHALSHHRFRLAGFSTALYPACFCSHTSAIVPYIVAYNSAPQFSPKNANRGRLKQAPPQISGPVLDRFDSRNLRNGFFNNPLHYRLERKLCSRTPVARAR